GGRIGGSLFRRSSHAVAAARLNHLNTHDRVLIKEPARVVLVGSNAADHRGRVYHHFGTEALEEPPHRLGAGEIQLPPPGRRDLAAPYPAQPLHDAGTQKPRPARNEYAFG